MCITKFEESWGLQAMMCDTRGDQANTDEIFIAPLGMMSRSVEKAMGYLKIVTLMNEVEKEDFSVKEVIEAISRINERYARRIIPSQSVHCETAWMETEPYRRGNEATTTKKRICVNSKLSLPHGGEWVDV